MQNKSFGLRSSTTEKGNPMRKLNELLVDHSTTHVAQRPEQLTMLIIIIISSIFLVSCMYISSSLYLT